jgi:hypothetical protein
VAALADALEDHSPQAVAARIAVASENTWDQRIADIYRILQPHLHPAQQELVP